MLVSFYFRKKNVYTGFFLRYAAHLGILAVLWLLWVLYLLNAAESQNYLMQAFGRVIGLFLVFLLVTVTVLFGILASHFFSGYLRYLYVVYLLGKPRGSVQKKVTVGVVLASVPPYLLVIAAAWLALAGHIIGVPPPSRALFLLGNSLSFVAADLLTVLLCKKRLSALVAEASEKQK